MYTNALLMKPRKWVMLDLALSKIIHIHVYFPYESNALEYLQTRNQYLLKLSMISNDSTGCIIFI